jgi:type IV pilus assembly protein PilF
MALLKAACLASLLLLMSACISTGEPLPKSSTDAAQYNMELGIGYLRQGNLEAAKEKLLKAIDHDPGLATAHTALGLVYERLEDLPGAERQYRRAVSISPDDPDALNSLGVFLCARRNRSVEGLDFLDRALAVPLSRMPANRAMLNTNAGICAKPVDLPRAEAYLRTALSLDATYPEALLQLADVTFSQGNALQARAFLERHVAAAGASPAALWLGVRVEKSLKDNAAAGRYAQQLKEQFPESVETRQLLEQERGRG